ncbi:MAG: DUF1611 domain-containing protein [Woeseiaceae bacterium]|nr:DUF1611 domain-containing protein [Woeseiaceae bacterium]
MDGNAIVYCEGSFATEYGKTAHGLVRHTARYDVVAVIDSTLAGRDAGDVLDGAANGIPIVAGIDDVSRDDVTHFVIGMATDGGTLPAAARSAVIAAMRRGLNVDNGLHELLGEDAELAAIAQASGVVIRDIRKPSGRHFFTGDIIGVRAKRIAVLGTDCAIGKRTTAVILVNALNAAGVRTELIGTGQTSWLQGVRYGFMLDATIDDFVGGELEHVIVAADRNESPDIIIVEGQASLTHPAGSGGFEILSSAKPHGVVLQVAPGRTAHSGYPDFPLAPPQAHVQAIELLFDTRVVAAGVNPEGIDASRMPDVIAELEATLGIPCCNPLVDGPSKLITAVTAL